MASTTASSAALQREGGYLVDAEEKARLQRAYWDEEGRRTADTIARPAAAIAAKAGITLPAGKSFFIVEEQHIGRQHPFSTEKLGVVLAIFKYRGFDKALDMVRQIFETGGKGHSCGIYSFNDEHIHRLALTAPVSRMMVRQVQSSSNAGNFTNGMPHDLEHGLRHLGRQHHQREHLPQALHERHLGEPADPRGQALGAGAVRRVLRQPDPV